MNALVICWHLVQHHDVYIDALMHILAIFEALLNESCSVHTHFGIFQILLCGAPLLYHELRIAILLHRHLKLSVFGWSHKDVQVIIPRNEATMTNRTKGGTPHDEIGDVVLATHLINVFHDFKNFVLNLKN